MNRRQFFALSLAPLVVPLVPLMSPRGDTITIRKPARFTTYPGTIRSDTSMTMNRLLTVDEFERRVGELWDKHMVKSAPA